MSEKQKYFHLENHYTDGTKDQPEIHQIDNINPRLTMGRKDFLATTALAISSISLINRKLFAEDKNSGDEKNIYKEDCGSDIFAHGAPVSAICFTPDMQNIISISGVRNGYNQDIQFGDMYIKIWSFQERKLLKSINSADYYNPEDPWKGTAHLRSDLQKISGLNGTNQDETNGILDYIIGEADRFVWDFNKSDSFLRLYSSKRFIVLGVNKNRNLIMIEPGKNKTIYTIQDKKIQISIAAIDPGEKYLAHYEDGKFLFIRVFVSGKVVSKKKFHDYSFKDMQFSHDGSLLFLACNRGVILVLDTITLEKRKEIPGDGCFLKHIISVSPRGDLIASATKENLRIIRWPECDIILKTPEYSLGVSDDKYSGVSGMKFSPDSRYFVYGLGEGKMHVREISKPENRLCYFDPAVLNSEVNVCQFEWKDSSGIKRSMTGSTLPSGASCTCNLVQGNYTNRRNWNFGGGSCSCNQVCTCVPVK